MTTIKTIKAKYANGVITPLESLDLPDDTPGAAEGRGT